jgi:hypothetical protein
MANERSSLNPPLPPPPLEEGEREREGDETQQHVCVNKGGRRRSTGTMLSFDSGRRRRRYIAVLCRRKQHSPEAPTQPVSVPPTPRRLRRRPAPLHLHFLLPPRRRRYRVVVILLPLARRLLLHGHLPRRRVALTPGCQTGYTDHAGCHQLNRVLAVRPTRFVTPGCVSWLRGPHWLSSAGVLTANKVVKSATNPARAAAALRPALP